AAFTRRHPTASSCLRMDPVLRDGRVSGTIDEVSPGGLVRSVTVMTSVVVAVLLTLAVLLYHWQESLASKEFVESARFLIWAVLLCAQSALWVILIPPTWKSLRSLYSDFGADR